MKSNWEQVWFNRWTNTKTGESIHFIETDPNAMKKNVLTDGMVEFAKLCECDWLLTDIDAYFITNEKNISEGDNRLWIARIEVNGKAVMSIREDDGIKPIVTQEYSSTDFPLKEFEFYIIKQEDFWVYLLKSEY